MSLFHTPDDCEDMMMEQKMTTAERLEKELQGKIKVKRWAFLGGFATVISVFLEFYSDPYGDNTYPYAQIFLAVVCFGYGASLLYSQKRLETALAALHSETKEMGDTPK